MIEAHIRIRWKTVFVVLGAVVFVVGVVTGVHGVISVLDKSRATAGLTKAVVSKGEAGKDGKLADVNSARFSYLEPGQNKAWQFDKGGIVYDEAKGVVKYAVTLEPGSSGSAAVTVSQQAMPEELKPRTSDKFNAFIKSSNVARSQDAGGGTLYFRGALQNGAPANGADTVIFATGDVLVFGQSDRIVPYDGWAKLLGSMKKASK